MSVSASFDSYFTFFMSPLRPFFRFRLVSLVFVPIASFVSTTTMYPPSLPIGPSCFPSYAHHTLELFTNLVVYGSHVYKTVICVPMELLNFPSSSVLDPKFSNFSTSPRPCRHHQSHPRLQPLPLLLPAASLFPPPTASLPPSRHHHPTLFSYASCHLSLLSSPFFSITPFKISAGSISAPNSHRFTSIQC